MKQRIPKAIYNKEFREQAFKQVAEDGLSASKTARRLSLPPSTLANWVTVAEAGKLSAIGKTQRPLTEIELELELARIKPELAEVKMERDLLKKAAAPPKGISCGAYFAKEVRRSTR